MPATDYNLLIKAPTDTNTRRLLEKPELGRKLSVAQVGQFPPPSFLLACEFIAPK